MDEVFPFRVLVCGGRDYADGGAVHRALWAVSQRQRISLVIEGGARGADMLGRLWALKRAIPVFTFPADWTRYGNAAGPARNAKMLKLARPHLVVAFPGGAGTADMVSRARAEGIEVEEIRE